MGKVCCHSSGHLRTYIMALAFSPEWEATGKYLNNTSIARTPPSYGTLTLENRLPRFLTSSRRRGVIQQQQCGDNVFTTWQYYRWWTSRNEIVFWDATGGKTLMTIPQAQKRSQRALRYASRRVVNIWLRVPGGRGGLQKVTSISLMGSRNR